MADLWVTAGDVNSLVSQCNAAVDGDVVHVPYGTYVLSSNLTPADVGSETNRIYMVGHAPDGSVAIREEDMPIIDCAAGVIIPKPAWFFFGIKCINGGYSFNIGSASYVSVVNCVVEGHIYGTAGYYCRAVGNIVRGNIELKGYDSVVALNYCTGALTVGTHGTQVLNVVDGPGSAGAAYIQLGFKGYAAGNYANLQNQDGTPGLFGFNPNSHATAVSNFIKNADKFFNESVIANTFAGANRYAAITTPNTSVAPYDYGNTEGTTSDPPLPQEFLDAITGVMGGGGGSVMPLVAFLGM